MQLALYRAERPEVFDEIIGQKQIVRILRNQIRTGTVSQAYLFTGTHGTGKTTTARILAKAVNCLAGDPGASEADLPCGYCENCEAIREGRFVDVVELDAASNNGVDDLRSIIDLVKYPPTVGRYKVYIIDEVHMLSQAAENAFLKTLEEPPEYAIFILATTDPQKVRATIRSRCMELNFKRVSEDELVDGMKRICKRRGVSATDDALGTIAARADGSVRDALSILEQCMAAGDEMLNKELVLEYTGAAGEDFYIAITSAVGNGDLGKALLYIDEIIRRGKDARQLLRDWLEHYRNLMIVKYVDKAERIISASAENIERLRKQAATLEIEDIEMAIRLVSEYINLGRYSDRPRILLETVAVRLSGNDAVQNDSVIGKRPRVSGRRNAAPARQAERSIPAIEPREKQISGRDEDDEPVIEISAAPREQSGDAEDMWNHIVGEISRYDRSFESFIGRHSRGSSFDDGELVVVVKKNKLQLAMNKTEDINRTAVQLYGSGTRVTIREGDPDKAERRHFAEETVTNELMSDDERTNELADDIGKLFGMDVDIIDK